MPATPPWIDNIQRCSNKKTPPLSSSNGTRCSDFYNLIKLHRAPESGSDLMRIKAAVS